MYVSRQIEQQLIKYSLDNKALVVLGARQVGKTTMLRHVFPDAEWYSGDDTDIRTLFSNSSFTTLQNILGKAKKVVVIDEAQRIANIGLTAKIIVDQMPHIKLVLSGSSAFELSNEINEPLTGRKWELMLYPLSFSEMANETSSFNEKRLLEQRMLYGYYPDIVAQTGEQENLLQQLADAYLYKDILTWENIQKPEKLERLLKAIAFQIGNLVSTNELAQICGLNHATVERYIDLLEKAFIIFRLGTFTRNLRNELNTSRKIYFYDTGLRNAVINNFRPIENRNDNGALWENFILAERIKYLNNNQIHKNTYFWRTKDQAEIDYIEEGAGQIEAYEFKWNDKKKVRFAKSFVEAYHPTITATIHPENFVDWV